MGRAAGSRRRSPAAGTRRRDGPRPARAAAGAARLPDVRRGCEARCCSRGDRLGGARRVDAARLVRGSDDASAAAGGVRSRGRHAVSAARFVSVAARRCEARWLPGLRDVHGASAGARHRPDIARRTCSSRANCANCSTGGTWCSARRSRRPQPWRGSSRESRREVRSAGRQACRRAFSASNSSRGSVALPTWIGAVGSAW